MKTGGWVPAPALVCIPATAKASQVQRLFFLPFRFVFAPLFQFFFTFDHHEAVNDSS